MSPGEAPGDRPSWRHRLFLVAVVVKGMDGLLEVVGGVLLLALGPGGVGRAVAFLTQHELAEDPNDILARTLVRHSRDLGVGTVHFAAAYLLVHGIVKLWLVGGLIRERRRVFPIAIAFLLVFILYQVYRLILQPSLALAVLTIVDLAIIALVWREYTALRTSSERAGVIES